MIALSVSAALAFYAPQAESHLEAWQKAVLSDWAPKVSSEQEARVVESRFLSRFAPAVPVHTVPPLRTVSAEERPIRDSKPGPSVGQGVRQGGIGASAGNGSPLTLGQAEAVRAQMKWDTDRRKAWQNEARYLLDRGEPRLAGDLIEEGERDLNGDFGLDRLLFEANIRTGDYPAALAVDLRALAKGKNCWWDEVCVATALMGRSYPGEREYLLRRRRYSDAGLLRMAPGADDPTRLGGLAAFMLAGGEANLFYLDLSLRMDPGDPFLLSEEFSWLESLGRYREALKLFDLGYPKMLPDPPNNAPGYPYRNRLAAQRDKLAQKLGLPPVLKPEAH